MGRITVFAGNDILSKRVKDALERRDLPYTELSVVSNPHLVAKLNKLASTKSVPQVFFNSRHIGGWEGTLKELKMWDDDSSSPFARYRREIALMPDPANIPDASFKEEQERKIRTSITKSPVKTRATTSSPGMSRSMFMMKGCPHEAIDLPDGNKTSAPQMTEYLKEHLSFISKDAGETGAANCFSGAQLVKCFINTFPISESEASNLAQVLLDSKIIHHSDNLTSFRESAKDSYQLQCDKTPDILNSYCVWTTPSSRAPEKIVEDAERLLTAVELGAVNSNGELDYQAASLDPKYRQFEEMICELQVLKVATLYNVGIPGTIAERVSYLNKYRFNIGGLYFSFNEFLIGVLRGNADSQQGVAAFKMFDRRKKLSLTGEVDYRIHFALNLGVTAVATNGNVPFDLYSSTNLDEQLDIAAKVFCGQEYAFCFDEKTKIACLPSLFGWYRADFGSTNSNILGIVRNNVPAEQRRMVAKAIKDFRRVEFMPADWGANATNYIHYYCEP